MNRTTIIGKLTKEPEFQDRGSFAVVGLVLQHSRYAGKDQQTGQAKYETEFFDVEIQGHKNNNGRTDEATAFMQRGLHKGDWLWVECEQKTSYYEKEGQKKSFKRLVVDMWEAVNRPQPQQQQQFGQNAPAQGYAPAPGYQQPPQQGGYAPAPPQFVQPQPQYQQPQPQPQYPPQAVPAPAGYPAPPQPGFVPPPPQPQAPGPGAFGQPAPVPAPGQPPVSFQGGKSSPF